MHQKKSGSLTLPAQEQRQNGIIASLDIGSSKVSCFIAELKASGGLEVIGIGHHASRGVKSGTIIDLRALEQVIGQAVHAAETMARSRLGGQPLRGVFVNVPGIHTLSHRLSVDVRIAGHEITDKDVRSALFQARGVEVPGRDQLIHAIPASYMIDGHHGIAEPRGMFGNTLNVQISAITAMAPAVRNIMTALSQNHLETDGLCTSSYASGLACLVDDERQLGATVIDMGGGTSSIGVFLEGKLVFSGAIPVGGQHVTNDIARGLTTSLTNAERIKTLYGSAISTSSDDGDLIDVPPIGEDEHTNPNHIPRSLLIGIIQPRIEETFELIRAKMVDCGINQAAGRRVVLTGGASQLPGLCEMAQMILDKQVRQGHPLRIRGLADGVAGPAFSTTAGLLLYGAEHLEENPTEKESFSIALPGAIFQKVTHWLKENW